ncbi:MAG: transglutaminase domain-containing protein [bacterium]
MRKGKLLLVLIMLLSLTGCLHLPSISEKLVYLTPGESFQLSVSHHALASWESSDETIATVDDEGLVKAVAIGECTIRARMGLILLKSKVIVADEPVHLRRLWPLDHTYYITKGSQVDFRVDSDGPVSWQSSTPETAVCHSAGKTCQIEAAAIGNVMITASTKTEMIHWNLHIVDEHPSLTSDVETYLYSGLLEHQEHFTFHYNKKLTKNKLNQLLRESHYALADYNYLSLKEWKATYSQLGNDYDYDLTFTYGISKKKEEKFKKKLFSVMSSLKLKKLTDYQKIVKIHDYIIDHVTYDYDTADGVKARYYAYNALIEGKGVCQSYASLFLIMCRLAHVDSRVVIGTAEGGRHAWNIVKLNQKYYYVDATWDDQMNKRAYFLKGSKQFDQDHVADSFYKSNDFKETYSVSSTAY